MAELLSTEKDKNFQSYGSIQIPSFLPPGYSHRNYVYASLAYGQQIRDDYVWQYPLLGGSCYTYQQMCAEREWRVSGPPRQVARAVEYFNNAQTLNYDGTVDYGLEQLERRQALDYIAVGRIALTWGENGEPLRYLDPCNMRFDLDKMHWHDFFTNEDFPTKNMIVSHPIPIGNAGNFVSPLASVIPTAMMAWLIREHDRAAADGRKIRDIMLVNGADMADQIEEAIKITLQLWNGGDPDKIGVPVIYADLIQGGKMSDMFARLGLANIPETFDRNQFMFQYVNEIADALGLSLRHIWNAERATNRALEEVQEARQSQKGPAAYSRSKQRLYNQGGVTVQFGPKVRFNFIEEVDIASQQANAEVLLKTAQALEIFNTVYGATNADVFFAWMKSIQVLPSDIELIADPNMAIVSPGEENTPQNGNVTQDSGSMTGQASTSSINAAPALPAATATTTKSMPLDYEEISMNGKGEIIEARHKVFNFQHVLDREMNLERAPGEKKTTSLKEMLMKTRENNLKSFIEMTKGKEIEDEAVKSVCGRLDSLTDADYGVISTFLRKQSA